MSSSSPAAPRRVSIAIVDDDQSVRVSLRRLCEVLDMSATAYASGREFVASLDGGAPPPDCLLLDVQMPEMSGLELQRHLVATGRSIPTVAYTADDAPEILANYVAAGIVCYLRKPATGNELLAAVQAAVTSRAPRTDADS
jgi:FixJ family two-component response regulator